MSSFGENSLSANFLLTLPPPPCSSLRTSRRKTTTFVNDRIVNKRLNPFTIINTKLEMKQGWIDWKKNERGTNDPA